jgi:hypothetical protein
VHVLASSMEAIEILPIPILPATNHQEIGEALV